MNNARAFRRAVNLIWRQLAEETENPYLLKLQFEEDDEEDDDDESNTVE